MWGFSKKRFLVILGLSVLVWFISGLIQLFDPRDWQYHFSLSGSSCTVTGYPLSKCYSDYESIKIWGTCLFNIFFWFWIIQLLSSFIFRSSKRKP